MNSEHDHFEIRSQHGELIACIEDWFRCAPPKRGLLQWKDFRSAKELARSFFRSGSRVPHPERSEGWEKQISTHIFKHLVNRAVPAGLFLFL